jgi:phosphoglycolate phosphatase-like HAD superfamily hydrolase
MRNPAYQSAARCQAVPDSGLVVFDIDGTLTDTVMLHQAALLATIQSSGFPELTTDWSGYRHHTDSAISVEAWERVGWGEPGEVDRQSFCARFEREFERLRTTCPIQAVPGTVTFVGLLRDAGWSVTFATGGLREPSRIKLREAGITFNEGLLVTASDYLTRDEIVSAAIRSAKASGAHKASTPISVGDGLWDLLTAKKLGLGFLGVGTGPKAQLLIERGAMVLSDFTDPVRALQIMSAMISE